MLLRQWQELNPSIHWENAITTALPQLREIFWQQSINSVIQQIRRHIILARQAFAKSTLQDNGFMESLLQPLTQAVDKTEIDKKTAEQFIQTYKIIV